MTRTPRYPLAACLGLAVALIGLRGVSYAQPAAPTIACLRGDTLTWLDPTDACGPLSGLRVEAAPDAASAFEPVTTRGVLEDSMPSPVGSATRLCSRPSVSRMSSSSAVTCSGPS